MSDKKINLESIIKEHCYTEFDRVSGDEVVSSRLEAVLIAIQEICRQVLELAAENAEATFERLDETHSVPFVKMESILNTIKQIE